MGALYSAVTAVKLVLLLYGSQATAVNDGDLRLVGGTGKNDGLVEIYHEGQWGSICADPWTFHQVSIIRYLFDVLLL